MTINGRPNKTDTPVFETSVHSIDRITDSLLRHIKGYEKRLGKEANEKYVESFYKWIHELDALSDKLSNMDRFDVWVEIERGIDKLGEDVGGVIIYLPLKRDGHYALFDLR